MLGTLWGSGVETWPLPQGTWILNQCLLVPQDLTRKNDLIVFNFNVGSTRLSIGKWVSLL